MNTTYEKAVTLLTTKDKFQINLGLDRIGKILELFDNPQDKLRAIHVAGTNGKGSFCSIISSVLKEYGLKTGLFTSPHLSKYNERIRINGKEISDTKFYSLLKEINQKAKDENVALTEFEILTVAAFLHFEREKVDIVVLEVGLGGRLDATNTVKKPFLTVITSLSLDHTDRLGGTIEEIAAEKSGIIKSGVECVIGQNNAGINTVRTIAAERKAPLITTENTVEILIENSKNYAIIENEKYEFCLCGEYQAENLSLVLGAIWILRRKGIFIDESAIISGLKKVKHPARFEYYEEQNLIIDGAHNPDGAKVLRNSLDKFFPSTSVTFVYATINTKDYKSILKTLLSPLDELVLYDFTRTDAVNLKAENEYKNCLTVSKSDEIIQIINKNKAQNRLTVITGSLYAIGDLHQAIVANTQR